ncbi:MAG TPA: class I adenylate-forming enzyme family protein, partial [Desulfomonilia bacterium]|nr:class I adenylate-forming enzyme family protein [Desulfomonilia bacterium]
MGDKSFRNLAKAIPVLATMEQTRGLLKTFSTQWGAMNALRIIFKTGSKTGHMKTLKALMNFRLEKITPNFLVSMWEVFGDREALISEGRRFTYNDLKDRVFRLANALQALGLKPKDRCAELLCNGNEFFEGFFACSLIGCPMPFLNWHLQGEELIDAVNRVKPRVLILHDEFAHTILSIRDRLPSIEHYIVVGKVIPQGAMGYEDLLSRAPNAMPEAHFAVALNPYTGGTTGTPKNINYFDSIGYAFSDLAEAPRVPLDEYLRFLVLQFSFMYWFGGTEIKDPITKNMRCLIPGPLYHAGSIAGWVPFILLGGTGIPVRRFDPEDILKTIEQERINWVFVVPAMLERIHALPETVKNRYNLSSMHTVICAAAPATPELKRATNEFFNKQGCSKNVFTEFYGSSETAVASVLLPRDYEEKPKRFESVGKIRCADTKVFDEKTSTWCPPGKDGKILTRSLTTVSLNYVGSPEKLEGAFKLVDGELWFDDGLKGHMDEDGFLYLTGREKEMIITGGVNIFPNEIEAAIKRHIKVLDVAVVRYPHKELGEVPAAVIQLKDGHILKESDIIEHLKGLAFTTLKIPHYVEFVDT